MKNAISISLILMLVCSLIASCNKHGNDEIQPQQKPTVQPTPIRVLFTVDNPKRIKGKIRRADDGAPIAMASIAVRDLSQNLITSVFSNSSGIFVTDSIQPGDYYVITTATGFAPHTDPVTISGEDIEDYDLGDVELEDN